mmetsp:Transcript_10683/g.33858  ORF Transcript_10683/g.33858 Transcript_10683/m.33858 type:complete len:225 (+) Transcript_10683:508-1182(+)
MAIDIGNALLPCARGDRTPGDCTQGEASNPWPSRRPKSSSEGPRRATARGEAARLPGGLSQTNGRRLRCRPLSKKGPSVSGLSSITRLGIGEAAMSLRQPSPLDGRLGERKPAISRLGEQRPAFDGSGERIPALGRLGEQMPAGGRVVPPKRCRQGEVCCGEWNSLRDDSWCLAGLRTTSRCRSCTSLRGSGTRRLSSNTSRLPGLRPSLLPKYGGRANSSSCR